MSPAGDHGAGRLHSSDPVPKERIRGLASRDATTGADAADLGEHLDTLGDLLGRSYREIHDSEELANTYPRLVEWLLDNEYLVRRSVRQARDSVPPSFERRLPRLSSGPRAGRPRIAAVAREILAAGQYHLDRELLLRYVDAFQEERALTTGELWALPAYLRVAALERLAVRASEVLDVAVPDPLSPTGEGGPAAGPVSREVGRCVESLRWLDEEDWRPIFERLSRVEAELRRDPSGHYRHMDFESRDRYRKAVEEVATWSGKSELDVASMACRMARNARDGAVAAGARGHVGRYLVGDRRSALEERAGARVPLRVRMRRWGVRRSRPLYFGGIAAIALALLAALQLTLGGRGPATVLLLASVVPAVTLAVSVVRWIVTHTAPTRTLPKLEIEGDLPDTCRTAVVVPCLLGSEGEVDELLEKLEVLYEGNGDRRGLTFGLLSDFTDAPEKEMPGDGRLLDRVREGVEELNRRHGRGDRRPFFVLHRERVWNPGEGCWMGWERKRGKLEEFNQVVLDEGETSYAVAAGNVEHLSDVAFALTLDADTRMPPGEAARLVGTMAHPMNRPVLDASGELRAGYSILQPRLQSAPPPDGFTIFARIQEGNTGLDLYSHAVSDVYQDLFGEGIFVGKGIYDVEAFHRTTVGRVPENSLLSHDIFEGICGRAGLVSDVVLLEDYPGSVLTYLRRLHRWIRGDWQWLPWLLPRVPTEDGWEPNPFDFLDRWKIADNLFRSLLPPSLVVLAAVGWISGTLSPWIWTGLVAATPGVPIVLGAAGVAARQLFRPRAAKERRETKPTLGSRVRRTASVARLQGERWALSTTLLLAESMVAADAVVRTLVRMTITRRHLLEWTTAAQAARGATDRALVVWREMSATVAAAVGLAGLVALLRPGALPAAIPLLAAWILSPQVSHLISRRPERGPEELEPEDRRFLREVALRTWTFFERFTRSEDHWLPPDNFRESGGGRVARRTSPTNIGLGLTSTLAARDLGFVGPLVVEASLRNTLESMERLERYRGHFLNWYSTRDMSSLEPRYVSTVDSGNLASALVVVSEGAAALPREPVLRSEQVETLDEVLGLLADQLSALDAGAGPGRESLQQRIARLRSRLPEVRDDPSGFAGELVRLRDEELPALREDLVAMLDEVEAAGGGAGVRGRLASLRIWFRKLNQQVSHTLREVQTALPWLAEGLRPPPPAGGGRDGGSHEEWRSLRELLTANPPLAEIPGMTGRARERLERLVDSRPDPSGDFRRWAEALRSSLETGAENARRLTEDLAEVSRVADRFARDMDFAFLYDRSRDLFHLGFDLSAGELDSHHYDLLASEARLAGLIAVSRGDAPPRHWLHLGRPFGPDGGSPVLLSWGGSMFEYLLPAQFTRTPPDSLLERGNRQAIRAHVRHGRRHDVPWGLSEAAYRTPSDPEGYGYRAFGVPDLALRRGADDPLVVAPYASALALPFAPAEATRNLERFRSRGLLADYGFYESLDLGPRGSGGAGEPVRAFMAHHQGMTLLGIVNCLHDGRMVDRFHASAGVEAAEHLLHEQAPWQVPVEKPWTPPERERPRREKGTAGGERWQAPEDPVRPQIQLLSNGSYRVLISSSGGGGSFWDDRMVTRWAPDPTVEERGTSVYLRDRATGDVWTVGRGGAGEDPPAEECEMSPHEVRFHRRQRGLALDTRITVAPDFDVEIRYLRISNSTARARRLTVTSYGEVSLAPPDDDLRHPAYSRLFVEPEVGDDGRTLLYRRRSRESRSSPAWAAHFVVGSPWRWDGDELGWETDRARFLGRNGSPEAPRGVTDPTEREAERPPSSIDPIFSLSGDLELEPFDTVEVAFVTAAGASRSDVLDLRARFDTLSRLEVAFEDAESASLERRARLGLGNGTARRSQELVSGLLGSPVPGLAADAERRRSEPGGRPDLWSQGISGDSPILLVRVPSPEDVAFVDQLLRLQREWSELGFRVDLVLLHGEPPGYVQRIRDRVESLLERLGPGPGVGDDGGVHLVSEPGADDRHVDAVCRAASVVLHAEDGSLAEQLAPVRQSPDRLPAFVPVPPTPETVAEETPPLPEAGGLEGWNGYGGFADDGDYVVRRDPDRPTPAPWVNVISNPEFGFLASEASLGCTWSRNSGERRLTPWRNDPVLDRPSEVIYLRDEKTADVWSATPLPAGGDRPYLVRHGPGRTSYRHHRAGLVQTLRLTAAPEDAVKIAALEVENTWDRPRRITATYYAEWVLGQRRPDTVGWLSTDYDDESHTLLARNPGDPEHGDRVAFLTSDLPPHGLTADRTEFLGRAGGLAAPSALDRIGLSDRVQPEDADPCAAYQVHLDLEPGETATVHFVLGDGRDRDDALELASAYSSPEAAAGAARRQRDAWEDRLGKLTVRTPDDEGLDRLLNRWLPYQTLSSRLWARTAAYQSSGAFGFRDQLQDVLALLHHDPDLARDHLLRAAGRQFEAGDVLHWWQPHGSRGVRTRCSDDLLWLPYAAARYVRVTGDRSVLDEVVPFLEGPELGPEETERYAEFARGGETGTLYEHCLRAVERGDTAGPHGLPLIGSGDWNDGMDRVGAEGRGESVWLGWFLCRVMEDVAEMAEERGDRERADDLRQRAAELAGRVEEAGWDGSWYRRAYYDDGTPLGSAENREARIDAISQAWSVLAGTADRRRAARAMDAVDENLMRREDRLVLLLTPPFRDTRKDPGYIRAYPPGVRENGGQYTHAAAWVGWAFADLGDADRAREVLRMLNPLARSSTPSAAERYAVEPYVQCADVYGADPFTGRGGWTWYTGSAAWTYRLAVERILGLRRRGDRVRLDPCPPPGWEGWEMRLREDDTEWRIRVRVVADAEAGVQSLQLDGEALEGDAFPLRHDGGGHEVVARVGRPEAAAPSGAGGAAGETGREPGS